MKQKYIYILALLMVATAIWAGITVRKHVTYVRGLEETHVRQMQQWVVTQRGFAYRLDVALAEALAATGEGRDEALAEASETAWQGRDALFKSSLLSGVNRAVDKWRYASVYEKAGSYLYYLVESGRPLGELEVKNLELIREYMEVFSRGFDELLPYIIYEVETVSGQVTFKSHPWKKIVSNAKLVDVLDKAGTDFNQLPEIGGDDEAYKEFAVQRRGGAELPGGLAGSGERVYSEEEMLAKARNFLKTIVSGDIIEATGPGSGRAGSGWGMENSFIGEYMIFALQDKETGRKYEVGVTAIGGHIFSVDIFDENKGIGTPEEIVAFGDLLAARWADFEKATLERMETYRNGKEARLRYAAVEEGVLLTDTLVEVGVYTGTDNLGLKLDAERYFTLYGRKANLTPGITPEEAVKLVNPRLKVAGELRLEMRRDGARLIYVIPVSGVKWVEKVYINAVTGDYEGMEYNYRRP